MKRLTRYRLDFEKTYLYLLRHLEWETKLSKMVVDQVDFKKGKFYVDLPEECHVNRIYHLKSGGMTPTIDLGAENEVNANGNEYSPQFFMSTDWEMCFFIKKFLSVNPTHVAIFDEPMLRAAEKGYEISNVKNAYDDQEIYYLLNEKNSLEEVCNTINALFYAWRSFALLVDCRELDLFNPFIEKNRQNILDSLRYIIIGAYDGEGYLVWEKN